MVKDIIIDDDGDLVVTDDGDFSVKSSDEQHVVLLFNTALGSWKQWPLAGIGIQSYLGSSGQTLQIQRLATLQLQADGYRNVKVTIVDTPEAPNYYVNAERAS